MCVFHCFWSLIAILSDCIERHLQTITLISPGLLQNAVERRFGFFALDVFASYVDIRIMEHVRLVEMGGGVGSAATDVVRRIWGGWCFWFGTDIAFGVVGVV